MLARYHHDGDRRARTALVERFLPLASQLARRYGRGGEPLDDLIQVASVGLLKAIDRFDVDRGTAFTTFAVPTILGELRRHFRDTGWSVRLPRDLQELALRVERLAEEFTQTTGRTPTTDEVARSLGVSEEQVLEAREAAGAHRAVSLDEPLQGDDGDLMGNTVGAEDPRYGQVESAATLEDLMCVLDARDRQVLRLRFVEDLTQSEIGARMGISQMHVSRVIRQAISRLQDAADGAA
ncbi:MAG: SigB/SigF/SigG family RNA polymerase sigma factor [Solirubrobacteraceae bacterium]